VQLGDHLVEQELSVRATCLDQDRTEVCPRNLHLAIRPTSPHARHTSAIIVNKDQLAHPRRGVLQAGENTQPLRDLIRTLADIDRIAARSDTLIAFHDCYAVSSPTE